MSTLKRISKFMKPGSKETSSSDDSSSSSNFATPPPQADHHPVSTADLRNLLVERAKLAETDPNMANQQLAAKLNKIAAHSGIYLTASEWHKVINRMRTESSRDDEYHAWAYDLAGQLYLQHIGKEIRAIDAKGRPMGPNVFKGYCDELIEAFFLSTEPHRGIETVLSIAEELYRRTLYTTRFRVTYAALADCAIDTLFTHAVDKQERDTITHYQAVRQFKKGNGPEPIPLDPAKVITDEIIAYLRKIKSQGLALKERLERFEHRSPLKSHELENWSDIGQLRQQAGYFQAAYKALLPADNAPILGYLLRQLGLIQEKIEEGKGRELLQKSAKAFEALGDFENEMMLGNLAQTRYADAQKALQAAQVHGELERMKAKYAQLQTLAAI